MPIIKEQKKNCCQPPFQANIWKIQQRRGFDSTYKYAHNPTSLEAAFSLAELSLNRIARYFILVDLLSGFSVDLCNLGRRSQGRPRKPYTMFFAEKPIILISIYLSCMYRSRPTPKPPATFFLMGYQILVLFTLASAIPLHKAVSFYHAHRSLGIKLGRNFCLAPFDVTDIVLENAYNKIFDLFDFGYKHAFLLSSDLFDGQQVFILPAIQKAKSVLISQTIDGFVVAAQISQLLSHGLGRDALIYRPKRLLAQALSEIYKYGRMKRSVFAVFFKPEKTFQILAFRDLLHCLFIRDAKPVLDNQGIQNCLYLHGRGGNRAGSGNAAGIEILKFLPRDELGKLNFAVAISKSASERRKFSYFSYFWLSLYMFSHVAEARFWRSSSELASTY
jgi:hypothetical protein